MTFTLPAACDARVPMSDSRTGYPGACWASLTNGSCCYRPGDWGKYGGMCEKHYKEAFGIYDRKS